MNTNEIPKAHPELLDALHRQDEKAREMKLSEGFTEKVMNKVKSEESRFSRNGEYRILRRIAAIFIAAAFIGGLVFAAWQALSSTKEQPMEEANCQLPTVNYQLSTPVRFDDVRLDSILSVVSSHYGKAVSFRSEEAKGMKFIMAWDPDSSLTSFIDGLNMFDGLLLTIQQDTIFVETTEVMEDAK